MNAKLQRKQGDAARVREHEKALVEHAAKAERMLIAEIFRDAVLNRARATAIGDDNVDLCIS